jgi:hypothetical protein
MEKKRKWRNKTFDRRKARKAKGTDAKRAGNVAEQFGTWEQIVTN